MVNPSSFPDSPIGRQLKIGVKRRVQVLYFVLVVGQIVLQYDMKPRDEKMRRVMSLSRWPPRSRNRFRFKGKRPAETQRPQQLEAARMFKTR